MFRALIVLLLCSCWTHAAAVQNETAPKALSAEEVRGYLEAKGMGLAKAAELNGYPGPSHVLELAEQLGLDEGQRNQTRLIFETMRAQAGAAGAELIAKERELDALFAAGRIDESELAARLSDIGALQARIRGIHLNAHLHQKALLSAEQIEAYNRLRGYRSAPAARRSHAH